MRGSKNGDTVGITLRVPRSVLLAYTEIANRANRIAIGRGLPARTTAQDVMRHRLQALPFVTSKAKKIKGVE